MQSLLCVANGPGAKPRGTTNGIRSEVRLSAGQRAVNGGSRRSPPDLLLQLLDALGDDAHELIDLVGGDGQRRGQAQRAAARVDDRAAVPRLAVEDANALGVERAAGPGGLDELDGGEEPTPADVADDGALADRRAPAAQPPRAQGRGL